MFTKNSCTIHMTPRHHCIIKTCNGISIHLELTSRYPNTILWQAEDLNLLTDSLLSASDPVYT